MGNTTQDQPAVAAPTATAPPAMTQQQKMQLIAQLLPSSAQPIMQAMALRAQQKPQLPLGTPDGSMPVQQ